MFWITLVFAFIERGTDIKGLAGAQPWTPESLPDLPDAGRMGIGEMAGTVVANILLIAAILWVQFQSPITIDGQSYPLFDPALWSFWLPYFIVVAILEIAFAVVLWRHGRWTYGFAVANALLGAAFAIPAVWLWLNDLLLNPAIVDAAGGEAPGRVARHHWDDHRHRHRGGRRRGRHRRVRQGPPRRTALDAHRSLRPVEPSGDAHPLCS